MDKHTWQQVEQIFNQAMDLAPDERLAFVRTTCGDNAALCNAVMQLLAHEGQTLDINALLAAQASGVLALQQDLSGTVLGHYRLLRQIGHGGMGAVYLAERADKQFHKQVAVKLIATALVDATQLHAFKTERQILADLEHAAISRLLDGGTTADGMPYLVMEYVQGIAVDEYCQAANLSVTARLQLFVKIAQAVAFAHQNMVVHCDLKPSNILISRRGEPKLLDFGIAHLLTRSQADVTELSTRRLTLHYASPEQKHGLAVSTLSDVFALGVILQQLLADRSDTDLAYIVNQARQPEAAARYSSVTAFSDDIKRYLGKQPIQARPDSWWYRSKMFVRRNTASCTLALIMLLSVLSFGAMLWQQEQQVRLERDQARLQRDKAQAISRFVSDMLSGVDPHIAQGKTPTVQQILDQSSELLLQQADHALAQQPEVEAAVRQVIARTYLALGELPAAQQHLEQAENMARQFNFTQTELYLQIIKSLADTYQDQYKTSQVLEMRYQALALAEQLYGEEHQQTLGAISDLASAYHTAGELIKAQKMWYRLYQSRLKLLGADHVDVIHSLANLGIIHHWLGDYTEAERYYKQCLAKASTVLGDSHPRTLTCLSVLGSLYETIGRYDEALPLIRQHIARSGKVMGEVHPDTLRSQHNLADTYRGLGQLSEAEALFRQTLAQRIAVLGSDNIETLQSQMKLARVLMLQQRFADAEVLLAEAYDRHQQQLGAAHQATLISAQILADTYLARQHHNKAIQLYQRIVQLRDNSLGDHPDTINALAGMAQAYFYLQRSSEAAQSLQRAAALAQQYPQYDSDALQQARLVLSANN
jgi:eukaryotic-like serine/threonine-protein kinase